MRDETFDQAVCKQHDPDLWHNEETYRQAVRICRTGGPAGGPCPALGACLAYALDPSREKFTKTGVWGGTTPHARAALRARIARS